MPTEEAAIPEGYVETTSADVANRINYCHAVLTSDYFAHIFGPREDVLLVHDAAREKLKQTSTRETKEKAQYQPTESSLATPDNLI